MKNLIYVSIFAFASIFMVGCKKEEPKTPQQMLEGQWSVVSSNILGTTVPGDGSYLRFNAYTSNYSGVDFKASDTTTGSFTYSLNEAATVLTITDTSANGGNWNAAWDVLDLTESKLKITSSTFLGNLTVEFSK